MGGIPKNVMRIFRLLLPLAIAASIPITRADNGTWLANPVDNNWNNPSNWSSGTVPGGLDTATYGTSSITSIVVTAYSGLLDFHFQAGASAYTITYNIPDYFFFTSDGGVVNDSGVMQNFLLKAPTVADGNAGVVIFYFGATAGNLTSYTCEAGATSDGGAADIDFQGGVAGSAIIHNLGADAAGGVGGHTHFYYDDTSAESSTIINDGATAGGATGGATTFSDGRPTADNAMLIANGGSNGGGGGSITFLDGSEGESARLEVFGNGYLDISSHHGAGFSIGSLEGDGQIYLGITALTTGTNNLSTTFSGVLHPGGPGGISGKGAVAKIGTGTLTVTGANLYTAGTTVTAGTLVVSNSSGSGTGTGAVTVNGGTLGGSGTISGAVTVNSGAFLAPAAGTKKQATLTIQSALSFNSGSTYTYTFKAKGNQARTDKVVAKGVTIASGASFNFSGQAQGQLRQGLTFTVISNTSASAISGTFSNLPDGAILTVGSNNFQASYEGGDGNDLTLTVQ